MRPDGLRNGLIRADRRADDHQIGARHRFVRMRINAFGQAERFDASARGLRNKGRNDYADETIEEAVGALRVGLSV